MIIRLPDTHHWVTASGLEVQGWWVSESADQPVYAVVHSGGKFVVSHEEYQLKSWTPQPADPEVLDDQPTA